MSRHEGVSCDACMKNNFRGKRYKCLVCYDFDLCASCYDSAASNGRHTAEHPMQCILTRAEMDMYFGGEVLSSDQPQSFTCPFCGKLGYSETLLQEHVNSEHTEVSMEVICPVCASLPGGDPNNVTDDLATHLSLEHSRAPRDVEDPLRASSGAARVPSRQTAFRGRGRAAAIRGGGQSGSTSLSTSARESMDPIAELLSQLSGVRRGVVAAAQSTSLQLQQLQQQLAMERQLAAAARQPLAEQPAAKRRTQQLATQQTGQTAAASQSGPPDMDVLDLAAVTRSTLPPREPQFLLTRFQEAELSETEKERRERNLADRSLFVQELILSTLAVQDEVVHLQSNPEVPSSVTKRPAKNPSSGSVFNGLHPRNEDDSRKQSVPNGNLTEPS